jgi:phospholipid/cholesterol/gamma-HCH transport system substrate-binding protein
VNKSLGVLQRRPALSGLVVIAIAGAASVLLFQKSAIITALSPGEKLIVQLARDYKVEPYASVVKIAGTKVGVVQSVETTNDPRAGGPVRMTLKLNNGTRALLGDEPSAEIRPTTVLGGTYYVQLYPGGAKGEASSNVVPVQRTRLPVELDRLLSAIPPDAQQGLQGMTERLDSTFRAGVGGPLNRLLADAPGTLRTTGVVADALRGVNRDTDLAAMVTDLNKTAEALSAKPGQLRAVVDSLTDTSRVLGANAGPLDRTIATLPATLQATRTGADDLSVTLDKLTDTADYTRPTVRALDPLLRKLDPTLADLRPVLADLHPLLEDAKPVTDELAPIVDTAADVLSDLNGPVLDRVNGPVLNTINSEWHGLAPKYPQGGADGNKFYEDLAYMFAHITDATRYQNAGSHMLGFEVGAGSTSVEGTGVTAQQLQDRLAEMYGPPSDKTPPTQIGPKLQQGVPIPDPGQPAPIVAVPDLHRGTHK